jgi:hypothetical protein
MAVIFGRTSTTTLNRGVQLVVTPDFKVEAPPPAPPSGFEPGDFDFNDSETPYTTNTVTFTKSGRLYIEAVSGGSISCRGFLNEMGMYFYNFVAPALTNPNSFDDSNGGSQLFGYFSFYGVFDINVGDTLYFMCGEEEPVNSSTIVEFRIDGFSGTGTLISSFTAQNTDGCYLTTATVKYKGLADDGPELTAMRTLREYYRGNAYYDALIEEYYQNSKIIINGINNSSDPGSEYEFIYQSVLKVKAFIDNQQWEQAKDEYINTYLTLKDKYVN